MAQDGGTRRNSLPLVAIVGRPNVGKSRLFNRLTGTRDAIVANVPGVTRDRNYAEVEWEGRLFNLVDTGGFEPDAEDALLAQMREQAQLAIEEADTVIVVFDGKEGLLPADWEITDLMRRSRKRVYFAVNKVDIDRHETRVIDFHELGVHPLFAISAEHGRGVDELMDEVSRDCPDADEVRAARQIADDEVRVAVIGRPNVGKSTLINRLVGEDRLLTSEVPGTTRDAIDTLLETDAGRFLLIDTAGVRRRRSIARAIEKYSVIKAFGSIDRADVALLLLDGPEGPTDQDGRLLQLVEEKGRGVVFLVNKWDLVEKDTHTAAEYAGALRARFASSGHAPVEFISALEGKRVHRVLQRAQDVHAAAGRRIPTAELNRFLSEATARVQPPMYRNRRLKLLYMTQVAVRPPRFVVVCNYPRSVPVHYRRYLAHQLREAYGFEGSPIRLHFRPRRAREAT
jgi:GTP-binding protein